MADFDQEQFGKLCQALADRDKAGIDDFAPKVFKDLDKNGNGLISASELKAICDELTGDDEDMVSQKEVDQMISLVDRNGDGQIDFEEFVQAMTAEREPA